MLFLERLVILFVNILARAFVSGMGAYAGQATARAIGRTVSDSADFRPVKVRIIAEEEIDPNRFFPVRLS
jgi:hypothetical protein